MYNRGFIATISEDNGKTRLKESKSTKGNNTYNVLHSPGKEFGIFLKNETANDLLVNITVSNIPVLLNEADIFMKAGTKVSVNGYENGKKFLLEVYRTIEELENSGIFCEADMETGKIPVPEIVITAYKANKTYTEDFIWVHEKIMKAMNDYWDENIGKDQPRKYPTYPQVYMCNNILTSNLNNNQSWQESTSNLNNNKSWQESTSNYRVKETEYVDVSVIIPSENENTDQYYSVRHVERGSIYATIKFLPYVERERTPVVNTKTDNEYTSKRLWNLLIQCNQCKTVCPVNSKFCPECGKKLTK